MNAIQRRRMIRIRYVLEDWLPRITALVLGGLIAIMVL